MEPSRASFRLYLISDRKLAERHGGLVPTVAAALGAATTVAPHGAVAIQLRVKDLGGRELYELGRALREKCSCYGAPLLINDRIDVAIAIEADGVHLPVNSFEVVDARRLMPNGMIGVSAHDLREVARAAAAGADFAVYGPVFQPLSKDSYADAQGGEALVAARHTAGMMPVYALGGITPDRVHQLRREGALGAGVAVIGAVFGAADPGKATIELLRALE
jgi:thiamine-phosphate pyrophosphorylase